MLQNIQKQNHISASLCSLIRRDLLSTLGWGPTGNMEPFFEAANSGGNFILEGGKLDVRAKMWKDFGTAKASQGFLG